VSFIDQGIRPNDKVRINYNIDISGNESYDEYTVQQVVNNTTIILYETAKEPIPVSQRFEIYRPLTTANYAEIINKTNVYNDRRISLIYPGSATADGYTIEGYYLCAAVAALTSSMLPHRSITQQALTGISDLPEIKTVENTILNLITQAGITVLCLDASDNVIVRHSVTSGPFNDLNQREEMLTRNFDDITKFIRAQVAGIISNINDSNSGLTAVYDKILSTMEILLIRNYTTGLGGQVKAYRIFDIGFDPVFEDACVAQVGIDLPKCMNSLNLYLQLQKIDTSTTN
jgi:hypothetical protein